MSKDNIENINDEVLTEATTEETTTEETSTEETTTEETSTEEITTEETVDEEITFEESDKTSLHDYVKLSDKYADVLSSAYTMLFVGILGVIFLLCLVKGIIPISLGATSWLFYTVMGIVFGSFVIFGFISLLNAIKLKDAAKEEEAIIDEINTWADENIKSENIDEGLDLEDSIEELYFFRFARIKDVIMHQFENIDEPLIEELSEQIYQNLYENGFESEVYEIDEQENIEE